MARTDTAMQSASAILVAIAVIGAKSCGCRIGAQRVDETGKVWMIQGIEDLPADLEVLAFPDSNQFGDRHVVVGESIQTQVIASAGSLISRERLGKTTNVYIAGKGAWMHLRGITICPDSSRTQEERISDGA